MGEREYTSRRHISIHATRAGQRRGGTGMTWVARDGNGLLQSVAFLHYAAAN